MPQAVPIVRVDVVKGDACDVFKYVKGISDAILVHIEKCDPTDFRWVTVVQDLRIMETKSETPGLNFHLYQDRRSFSERLY